VSDRQGGEGRRRLVALLVLLAVAVPLVAVALVTGSDGSPATGLRIERSTVPGTSTPQIVVYVDDQSANVPRTAGGRNTVELECLDRDRRTVLRGIYPWPFTNTDQGIFEPHIHQNVTAAESKRIVRCRLNGTHGPLEGRPTAARPRR
jgi:hypothetical protein